MCQCLRSSFVFLHLPGPCDATAISLRDHRFDRNPPMHGWMSTHHAKDHGKVSVDGEPLTSGSVAFYPTAGGTSRSVPLSSDGTFLLSSTDPQGGLATGEYKVVIATDAVEGNPQPAVPNEYRDVATTPLKQLVRRTNSPQYFVYEIRTKMR